MNKVIATRKKVNQYIIKELTRVPTNKRSQDHINNKYKIQWDNELAVQEVYKMASVYDEPIGTDSKKNLKEGVMVWTNVYPLVIMKLLDRNLIKKTNVPKHAMISKIEIRSKAFIHDKPKRHVDHLHVTIEQSIPKQFMPLISKLSGSIYNYKAGDEFTACCDFYGAFVASLYTTQMYINGVIGAERAIELYNTYIMMTASEKASEIVEGKKGVELATEILKFKPNTDRFELIAFGLEEFVDIYEKALKTQREAIPIKKSVTQQSINSSIDNNCDLEDEQLPKSVVKKDTVEIIETSIDKDAKKDHVIMTVKTVTPSKPKKKKNNILQSLWEES